MALARLDACAAVSCRILLLATLLTACSESTTPDAVVFKLPGGIALNDSVTGSDALTDGTQKPLDDSKDTGASNGKCEFAESPQPGQPGATCTSGTDCESSFCIESANGKVCTRSCSDCCPTGFHCDQSGNNDTLFICLPKLIALCRPCSADAECAAVNAGALCLDYGDNGRFCGGACIEDSDCTADYACKDATGTTGASKQCVRLTGECACSPKSIAEGASTACAASNPIGSCPGTRKCSPQGLSACDAPVPATETCNGADDDCNGVADDPGAEGCLAYYPDGDSDGFGKADAASQCLCKAAGLFTSATASDCDDAANTVHTEAADVCNGVDDDCNGMIDDGFPDTDGDKLANCVDPDDDNDEVADAQDCAALDPAISPSATEACNGVDDNCNGLTDEQDAKGCQMFWTDADGDGAGKAGSLAQCLCKPAGLYSAVTGTDCDDAQAAVHPGVGEICNDVDDDCNGMTDEGCDDDKDSYCDVAMQVVGDPVACAMGKKDCDDTNAGVHPNQTEVCDNGLDDDCDGLADIGLDAVNCTVFFKDVDKDGFGVADSQCLCAAQGLYSSGNNKDCNDDDPAVSPATQEVCSNGKDDNCNGKQDEEDAIGCDSYWADQDADGFGSGSPLCICGSNEKYTTTKKGDCDDGSASVNPGAKEACNGLDDNCNGQIDEQDALGCTKYYADGDKDGFGDGGKMACLCAPGEQFVTATPGDCDDVNANANPAQKETCNGFDDSCDGQIDEADAGGCTPYFVDGDGDGWGDPAKAACLCVMIAPYSTKKGGDCEDKNTEVHPSAMEVCNGTDDNCSGKIDEENAIGCFNFLRDEDNDSFGLTGVTKCLCKATPPYSASQGGDCDDAKSVVNPKSLESCDGIDNNCDGATDNPGADGCSPYYIDKDGDGFGTYFAPPKCLCSPASPYLAPVGGDCDDSDGGAYPKAQELCDGKDNDCDGIVDQKGAKGCKTFYADGDGDGYGVSNLSQCTCAAESYFNALQGGDCNDQSSGVNPGAKEVCDGQDNNCNGVVDDAANAATYYVDGDGDGWGAGVGKAMCSAGGGYTVTKAGDCNDAAGAIHPGAAEACNGKDDNCNGTIDDGLSMATWYPDSDGDGWGSSAGKSACGAFAPYTASKTGDCNDGAAGIYPGAAEIACNGKDEDCNGSDNCGGVCAHDTCTQGGALVKGCSACVTSICNADPYCCNNNWDSICVNEVASVCGSAKCPGSCGHSLCSIGAKVTAGCDSLGCASKICAADPYCCNNSWDSICVGEISSVCGKNCN